MPGAVRSRRAQQQHNIHPDMALTSAERVRRYREKLKKNPEKFEEYKKKHAALVKSKTKKISDLSEAEKEKQREKWRNQKRKQKKNKDSSTNCAPSLSSQNVVSVKKKRRKSSILLKKYNLALKRIKLLKTVLQTTKKNLYRVRKKYEKCKEFVNKMKVNEEILESTLKESLKKCKTHTEKRITKRIVESDNVVLARKKTYVTKLLGLKGKIRKRKVILKNNKIKSEMENFYLREDISRCTAGKRECRTEIGSKRKEQIRYLTDTLNNLYKIYKSEGGKYSQATFYKYKPFFILTPSIQNRETCLCIKHDNFNFLLVALHKYKLLLNYKTAKDILTLISCNLKSYRCMNGDCEVCKWKKLDYHITDGQLNLTAKWMQWERKDFVYEKTENGINNNVVTKKTSKVLKEGTTYTLIKCFESYIPLFKKHYYTWQNQQDKYRECINSLDDNEALILCDFSENYSSKLAKEIQSMHFGASKQQITLHTGMIFWKKHSKSFCSVADNNCHGPVAIWAHLIPVIELVKRLKPATKIIHFFSDSPSSQYRQKKNFYLHNFFTSKLDLNYSTWSFTESGHGKGVADGIGGSVKRALDRHVSYGNDIPNGIEAHKALTKLMKSVECFYIENTEIENINRIIPKNLKTIPGTMKIHQIISTHQNIIQYRSHSCFCGHNKGLCCCFDPKYHIFKELATINNNLNLINFDANISSSNTTLPSNTGTSSAEASTSNGVNNYNLDNLDDIIELIDDDFSSTLDINDSFLQNLQFEEITATSNDNCIHEHNIDSQINKALPDIGISNQPDHQMNSEDRQNNIQISTKNLLNKKRKFPDIVNYNNFVPTEKKICPTRTERLITVPPGKENYKPSKSLKISANRKVKCATCEEYLSPFQTIMSKCMVCKKLICPKCSRGCTYFDYICHSCLRAE